MSKARGQQNRDKLIGWISEMKTKESPNWLDYWHGDTLSPKKIADELGFDSSAFKEKRTKQPPAKAGGFKKWQLKLP